MKSWKMVAASLMLAVGLSGAAMAQPRPRDWDGEHQVNRARDNGHRDHDRRDRDDRKHDRDRDRRDYYRNQGYYRGDGDRDDHYRNNGRYGYYPNGMYGYSVR